MIRALRLASGCVAILLGAGCVSRPAAVDATVEPEVAAPAVSNNRFLNSAQPGPSVAVFFNEASLPWTSGPADELANSQLIRGTVAIYEGKKTGIIDKSKSFDWVIEVVAPVVPPKKDASSEDEEEKAATGPVLRVQATDPALAEKLAKRALSASFPDAKPAIEIVPLDGASGNRMILQCDQAVRMSRQARWTRGIVYGLLESNRMVHDVQMPPEQLATGARAFALYDCEGVGGSGPTRVERVFNAAPMNCTVTYVCPEDIREHTLQYFKGVVFPGGSGKGIATALQPAGQDEVRQFVRNGGGYVGICAGAYLATNRIDNYLHMVGVNHYQPWQTGGGMLDVELTPEGQALFGKEFAAFTTRYNNGPLFFNKEGIVPTGDFAATTVLANFKTAVEKDGHVQEHMIGTPAIVSSTYGEGRILLISPHPETHEELTNLVARGLLWSARMKVDGLTLSTGLGR